MRSRWGSGFSNLRSVISAAGRGVGLRRDLLERAICKPELPGGSSCGEASQEAGVWHKGRKLHYLMPSQIVQTWSLNAPSAGFSRWPASTQRVTGLCWGAGHTGWCVFPPLPSHLTFAPSLQRRASLWFQLHLPFPEVVLLHLYLPPST